MLQVECIIMQSIIKCLALRYTYRRFSFMIRKRKSKATWY